MQQPSVVELTVAEAVQMDRLMPTSEGYVADIRGELLIPGTTTLTLERGVYCFETVREAHLRIIHGDVDAVTTTTEPRATTREPRPHRLAPRLLPWAGQRPITAFNDEASAGEAPAFTVE